MVLFTLMENKNITNLNFYSLISWLEATYNGQGYRSQLNEANIFLATPQSNWPGKKRSTLLTPLYYTRITRQKTNKQAKWYK